MGENEKSEKLHVLAICDDEATFRLRFRLVMQRVGIVTQNFNNFGDADSMIAQFKESKAAGAPFNVIFIDINLKGGSIANGLDLLKKMRDELNGEPIIAIISTSTRKEEVERARENKANAYIVKSGVLTKFTERMREFKAKCLDERPDRFYIFGEEDIV